MFTFITYGYGRTYRFALREAEGAGGGAASGSESGSPAQGGGTSQGQQKPSYEELMKTDKELQSFVDKLRTQGIDSAKKKWEADKQAEIDEAKRLEKMDADQKAAHEREKLEQKLREREAEITRRELKASAKEILAEKKLPLSLAELPLDYTSADKCKSSLDTLEKAFNEAVKAAVDERMKGSVPKAGQMPGTADDNAAINAIMGLPADTK